jgi:hypothetical protein
MAYYALINQSNIVIQVIEGRDETDLVDGVDSWETYYGNIYGTTCLETSYENEFRGTYAGIGYTYDAALNIFVAPPSLEA